MTDTFTKPSLSASVPAIPRSVPANRVLGDRALVLVVTEFSTAPSSLYGLYEHHDFTAGYAGLSAPVVGLGVVFQHLSPRVTLLIFSLSVGLGFLAAVPVLVRPFDANPTLRSSP